MSEKFAISSAVKLSDADAIEITFNLLPILHLLLSQHLFDSSDLRKSIPFLVYRFMLERDIPPITPLRDIEKLLDKNLRVKIAHLINTDPRVRSWGLFGQQISKNLIRDLQVIKTKLQGEGPLPTESVNGICLHSTFKEMILMSHDGSYGPAIDLDLNRLKPRKRTELAWERIRSNPTYTIGIANSTAFEVGKLVKRLIEISTARLPVNKMSPSTVSIFSNAVAFAEVTTSRAIFSEIIDCYTNRLTNYLPFAPVFQAAIAALIGVENLIGLTPLGWLTGFHGSKDRPFISSFKTSGKLAYPMYLSFKVVGIAAEQHQSTIEQGSLELKDHKSRAYIATTAHRDFSNPFRQTLTDDGKIAIGRHIGHKCINTSRQISKRILSLSEVSRLIELSRTGSDIPDMQSAFDIRFLERRTVFEALSANHSLFSNDDEISKVYHFLVGSNPSTKPDLGKIDRADRRWHKSYNKYIGHGFCFQNPLELANDMNSEDQRKLKRRYMMHEADLFETAGHYTPAMVTMAKKLLEGDITPKQCGFGPIEVDVKLGGRKPRITGVSCINTKQDRPTRDSVQV